MLIKQPNIALPVKCWEKLKDEAIENYEEFLKFLAIPPADRTLKAYVKLHYPDATAVPGNTARMFRNNYWAYRATIHDIHLAERVLAKADDDFVADKPKWNATLEKLRRKIDNYISTPDDDENHGLRKALAILDKENNAVTFLLGAHKALFGEKNQVELTIGPKLTLDLDKL